MALTIQAEVNGEMGDGSGFGKALLVEHRIGLAHLVLAIAEAVLIQLEKATFGYSYGPFRYSAGRSGKERGRIAGPW